MNKNILITLLLFMCIIIALPEPAACQATKSHEIGRLWVSMLPVGTLPDYAPLQNQMTYPGGDFRFQTRKNMERLGLWIGVREWTNRLNEKKSFYVSEGGYLNYEAISVLFALNNKKSVRQRLPLVDVNDVRESRLLDSQKSSTRSTSLDADERIITTWATDVGIEVTRTSYAFANRQHDCYIIQEYVFKNNGNADDTTKTIELQGQDLVDVYFGFWRSFIPCGDIGHFQMGEEFDEWCHYYGNQPGDSLRGFWYVYDGDNQRKPFDDTGDPSETSGEFLSPQYLAFGVLHADTDYSDETDAASQPVTVNFWPRERVHSHKNGNSEETLYYDLSSGIQSQGSDTGEFSGSWDARVQRPDVLIAFGPYQIPFGEDIRIVIFDAAASIDRSLAIEYGLKWKDGTLEWDGYTGDDAKNALLATAKDSIHQIAYRAEWVWEHGLAAVPDGPESPHLRMNAGPGKVELEWYYGNYGLHDVTPPNPDPDTGVQDFAGYRVFRADGSFLHEYKKIFECGGNSGVPVTNTYVDRDVNRGQSYYYYVTAFDDGSQNFCELSLNQSVESSHFSNRNFAYAVIPFEAAHAKLDSIYVVPNPFHAQGLEYGGTYIEDYEVNLSTNARDEDRLRFVGLPAKATIRIFTMHGDQVKMFQHPNPENPESIAESADEFWFQISDSWQTVKAGVYLYHIEGWNLQGEFIGTTTGKFVIIR
ncbi:hypothetical protein JXJ21_04090 [candidate division KSB1 bacterium]|nr:hypothetical protein [candidate division KSB1 bacterium]